MSRVGRPPRDNPFSSRYVEPGAVGYLFPPGGSAAALARRLEAAGGRGQVVGPHGSGKSTLLAALRTALAGWAVRVARLSESDRALPGRLWAPAAGRTLVVIDGFEQLGLAARWRVRRRCRRGGLGLLVTAHRPVGLPTLADTAVSADTAARVIERLLPAADRRVLDGYDLAARLHAHRGSMREVLFELYDRWEAVSDLHAVGHGGVR